MSPSSIHPFNVNSVRTLARELANATPQAILSQALRCCDQEVAISFSGAEDVVLIDMAARTGLPYRVFTLDTGRLHPETYRLLEQVRERYGIAIEVTFPDAGEVTALSSDKGLFSFYEDGHQECCQARKVRPLRKKLATLDAWVTGQRRDQSESTRGGLEVVEVDPAFSGRGEQLLKFNPLANWSSRRVWEYIREHEVPYNPLHERGYISIGCEPCTRAVLPNQHERNGRWWWEEEGHKECGLHARQARSG